MNGILCVEIDRRRSQEAQSIKESMEGYFEKHFERGKRIMGKLEGMGFKVLDFETQNASVKPFEEDDIKCNHLGL